jgi:hypothetical protein
MDLILYNTRQCLLIAAVYREERKDGYTRFNGNDSKGSDAYLFYGIIKAYAKIDMIPG